MKKEASYTLLAFMLVVIFGACHQSHKKELDLAYALVESNPDSALVFLSHINQDKLSEEEMAKYALVYFIWRRTKLARMLITIL